MIFLDNEYLKLQPLSRQATRWCQTETPDLYTNEFLFFACETSVFTLYEEKVELKKVFQ